MNRLTARHRAAIAPLLAGILLLPLGAAPSLAVSPTVECGQLSAYTAPDPSGPTDGSLGLGLSSTWVVLDTATISPAAATALPSGAGNGPTCLALGLDGDGKVTSIDFAAQGTVTGTVAFDGGSGYYIFADRILVPTTVTDAYPAIGALFATSHEGGVGLAVTFVIDTTTGALTGFDGHTKVCGAASLDGKGNGVLGKARIPAGALGASARAALKKAAGASACATIHDTGTIDPSSGKITSSANVVVALATPTPRVTPPSTTTSAPTEPPAGPASGGVAWVLSLAAGLVAGLGLLRSRRSTQRPARR